MSPSVHGICNSNPRLRTNSNMFGALNRFISRLDSEGPSQSSREEHGAFGFQVLRNKNTDIPIEPWYDLVIGINGRQLDQPDPALFAQEIRNCAGANVTLALWSAKGQRVRTLHVPVPTPSPTLGLTLQWTPLSSTEHVWHVCTPPSTFSNAWRNLGCKTSWRSIDLYLLLIQSGDSSSCFGIALLTLDSVQVLDVAPDSPADVAGLLPYGDYIVGTPEGNVHGEAGLGELVKDYLSRTLRLFVYNHEYAVTRLVTITPSQSWGGTGALGCILGFGALHRLPAPLTEPPAGPGETLFETARFSNEENRPPSTNLRSYPSGSSLYKTGLNTQSNDLLVPASLISPPPPPQITPTPSAPPKSGRKARKAVSPNSAFDEYFKEGERKSKEEDFTPSAKNAPPPPPKMGGPPLAKSPEPEKQVTTQPGIPEGPSDERWAAEARAA